METATTHVIEAYRHNRRWRPGSREDAFSQPIPACREEVPAGDELISLYDVRKDPEALAAAEARITCEQCREWLADEDHRLLLLDVDGWIRKHMASGDRDIRYVDIHVQDEDA